MTTLARSLAVVLAVALSTGAAGAQTIEQERDRGKTMLREIKKDLQKHYYDTSFHGLDLDAHFKTAELRMQSASSLWVVFAIVGQALMDLNDSHTRFFPPTRAQTYIYGWKMREIGDECRVLAVRPGGDAERQGLKAGDKLTSIAGFPVTRDTLWKLRYLLYTIRPVNGLRLTAESPGGPTRAIDIRTETRVKSRVQDISDPDSLDFWELWRSLEREDEESIHRYFELGDDVFVWQMPAFDLGTEALDLVLLKKALSRKALVIDMRGNSGGAVPTLERLIARTFSRDVTVGQIKERTSTKPWVVRPTGTPFAGKIIALVDSDSGSAAELYARVLQIEKRGIVLGDRTQGAVMRSRLRSYQIGVEQVIFYHANISEAAVVMSDGANLEGKGVSPDEAMLPTGADLAAGRDPVLARALQLAGSERTPEQAGAMFPITWSK